MFQVNNFNFYRINIFFFTNHFFKYIYLGSGLDALVDRYTTSTNALVGVDRAIIRLWRLLGLRHYLNETSQVETPLFQSTLGNITIAYQKLLMYSNYNGSFSFLSDQNEQYSSLYLTSTALGALVSPFMPVRDNVTINRTLSWVLSLQQQDGSFDDEGLCFHYRFCAGEFRRQSLTAIVLYSLTHNNVSSFLPEFVRHRLFNGEQSPIVRAQRYLESQLETVKPCVLTTTLIELALIQLPTLSQQLQQRIVQDVRSRQLTVVPETGAKYWKSTNGEYTPVDQLLANILTLSIYATWGDVQTTSDIARWIVEQREIRPQYDSILDAVFVTDAWTRTNLLFRQKFGSEKLAVVVDVKADGKQIHQFKVDSSNFDIRQKFTFTLPVREITYSASGFGIVGIYLQQIFVEDKQPKTSQPVPFQLTNEFQTMSWLTEVVTRTCLTYTPTARDQQLAKSVFNRTIVVEVQLPSGKMNEKQRKKKFFL